MECKLKCGSCITHREGAELIETLWNVNFKHQFSLDDIFRINRNIVECKFVWDNVLRTIPKRINRNIVECK